MKERDLQKTIVDIAHRRAYIVAHFRTAQSQSGNWMTPVGADGKGFPDLVMLRPPRLVIVECKIGYRKPEPHQVIWLDKWRDIPGAEVYVWTERDIEPDAGGSCEVDRILK